MQEILIEKNEIVAHESIFYHYNLSLKKKYQADLNQFNSKLIKHLQMLDPLHCIKVAHGKYKFFAGWELFNRCKKLHIPKIHIVIHSKDTVESYVQELSYTYMIRNILLAPERHQVFVELINSIANTSKIIRKELFGSLYSSSENKTTENIFNVTRKTVTHQIDQFEKNKLEKIKLENKSIFEDFFEEEGI